MTREMVQTFGEQRAPVIVGSGVLASIAKRVREVNGGRNPTKVLIVCDGAIELTWGEVVATAWKDEASDGIEVMRIALCATESAKSVASWQLILDAAVRGGLDRKSLIVAVGGGITTDIAGFAAASYLRGIPWIAVPTTLLGMVDAALGGKTGINLPTGGGALGKNLAGAFWPPAAVLCDTLTLSTLPIRTFRAGLAECVKHAMLGDTTIDPLLEDALRSYSSSQAGDQWRLIDLVARAAAVKLAIVARDPKEANERMLLNLGHTFAHAIESELSSEVLHGEAVALGLIAASNASVASGRMTQAQSRMLRDRIAALGFGITLPRHVSLEKLVIAAGFDKKREGASLTLVLPLAQGSAEIVRGENWELLRDGFRSIGSS